MYGYFKSMQLAAINMARSLAKTVVYCTSDSSYSIFVIFTASLAMLTHVAPRTVVLILARARMMKKIGSVSISELCNVTNRTVVTTNKNNHVKSRREARSYCHS